MTDLEILLFFARSILTILLVIIAFITLFLVCRLGVIEYVANMFRLRFVLRLMNKESLSFLIVFLLCLVLLFGFGAYYMGMYESSYLLS